MKSIRKLSSRPDTVLLASFFIFGVTWLLAPFSHGATADHLRFISNYEGYGQPWAWAFRLGDFISAILLAILVYRLKVWQKHRLLGWLLFLIAALAAIDVIFPLTCQPGIDSFCAVTASFSSSVHHYESSILAVVILLAVSIDIYKRQKAGSWLFLPVQILFITFSVTSGIPDATLAPLQFIYEVILLVWLVYILQSFSVGPKTKTNLIAKPYRLTLALWTGLNGLFSLVIAAGHLRLYGNSFALYSSEHSSWIPQETALIGVLLLYLARQVYRGQRRAAYVLVIIFGIEIVKYSLFDPRPVLTAIYSLTLILIFLSRQKFARNVGRINIHQRLYDFLVVFGGVVVALTTISMILISVGRFQHVGHLLEASGGYFKSIFEQRFPDQLKSDRLVQTAGIVIVATIGVSACAFFRPASPEIAPTEAEADRRRAEQILKKYSTSSEDYFKIWPPDKNYFFSPNHQSFVAYKIARGVAYALADPIGPATDHHKLLDDFLAFCQTRGWTVCFLMVGENSKQLYGKNFNYQEIGSSAVIDIKEFTEHTSRNKWWRWKLNQAAKSGLRYAVSKPPHSAKLLTEFKQVSDAWLARPGHRERGFGQGYFDVSYLNAGRVHYLTDSAGKAVAFTNELPVFSGRQATVDLLRYRPEQSAAMPFLLASMIKTLADEASFDKFDLGFVPFANLNSRAIKLARAAARGHFSAAGLEQFKGKFKPTWELYYAAYDGDLIDLVTLATAMESVFKYGEAA